MVTYSEFIKIKFILKPVLRSGSESPESLRKSQDLQHSPSQPSEKTIPRGFDSFGNPLDDMHTFPADFDEFGRAVLTDPASQFDRPVPAGFDADGHPLVGPKIKADPMVFLLLLF